MFFLCLFYFVLLELIPAPARLTDLRQLPYSRLPAEEGCEGHATTHIIIAVTNATTTLTTTRKAHTSAGPVRQIVSALLVKVLVKVAKLRQEMLDFQNNTIFLKKSSVLRQSDDFDIF